MCSWPPKTQSTLLVEIFHGQKGKALNPSVVRATAQSFTDQAWDVILAWLPSNLDAQQTNQVVFSAIKVACADGELEPEELQRLMELGEALDVGSERLMELVRAVQGQA